MLMHLMIIELYNLLRFGKTLLVNPSTDASLVILIWLLLIRPNWNVCEARDVLQQLQTCLNRRSRLDQFRLRFVLLLLDGLLLLLGSKPCRREAGVTLATTGSMNFGLRCLDPLGGVTLILLLRV